MDETTRWKRFSFGIGSLLVVMTLLSILFATLAQPLVEARKQRRLLKQLEKLGATVTHRGVILRGASFGRAILRSFGNEYDRDYLYALDFSGSSITDLDLQLLPTVPHLVDLDLSGTKITDAGMNSIAACSELLGLSIRNTQVSDAGIVKLQAVQKLARLDTDGTEVTYAALAELDGKLEMANFEEHRAIAEVKAFGGQVVHTTQSFEDMESHHVFHGSDSMNGGTLILGMNRRLRVGRSEIRKIAFLQHLSSITVHSLQVEPGSFADLPAMPELTDLEFWYTDITDSDLQGIARQTQARSLMIDGCEKVSDVGISELASLQSLATLVINSCPGVTTKSIDYLRQHLPSCEIKSSVDRFRRKAP